MTDDYTRAWLAELWSPCPELPRHERAEKRNADRVQQRAMEEMTVTVRLADAS